MIWGNVKSGADRALLRRWLAAGHELGNHSAHHLDLTKMEADAYIADVEAGRAGLAGFLKDEGGTARSASSASPSSTRGTRRPSSTPSAPLSPAPGSATCR